MPHNPLPALQVANEFLAIARAQGSRLYHTKLQKLAYYAHGWHLGLRHAPLLDEEVEAWPFGPVIPTIYHEFKHYGTKPIPDFAYDLDAEGESYTPRLELKYDRALCETVWDRYGSLTATQLSKLTHRVGTPWYIVWNRNTHGLRSVTIPNDLIEEIFAEEAKKNRGKIVRS